MLPLPSFVACVLINSLVVWQLAHGYLQAQTKPADSLSAQSSDTLLAKIKARVEPPWPVPRRAVLYSLACPGLGQAYNKRWWKIPIVAGAFGTVTYFALTNHLAMQRYVSALRARAASDSLPLLNDPYSGLSDQSLRRFRDFYRGNRDLTIIIGVACYALTAVEAYVDAHLRHFTVSDNLAYAVRPLNPVGWVALQPTPVLGLQLDVRF
jgi:hypothetical protein